MPILYWGFFCHPSQPRFLACIFFSKNKKAEHDFRLNEKITWLFWKMIAFGGSVLYFICVTNRNVSISEHTLSSCVNPNELSFCHWNAVITTTPSSFSKETGALGFFTACLHTSRPHATLQHLYSSLHLCVVESTMISRPNSTEFLWFKRTKKIYSFVFLSLFHSCRRHSRPETTIIAGDAPAVVFFSQATYRRELCMSARSWAWTLFFILFDSGGEKM